MDAKAAQITSILLLILYDKVSLSICFLCSMIIEHVLLPLRVLLYILFYFKQ